jgi:alkylation response protein AidB-like acyl-CoA dehydrogenase
MEVVMGHRGNSELLDKVAEIEPVIREQAAAAEEARTLTKEAHGAMRQAGLFRMFVPKALGGLEVDAVSGFEAIEAVSRIDSAAGWNLQIGAAPVAILALLPEAGVREICADPDTVVAGGFNPPGAAVPVEGGFRLSGRWAWASGCQLATWFVSPALQMANGAPEMGPDGNPILQVCFYPASEARVVETWEPLGMRGTGSHDIVAEEIFIPANRAGQVRPFSLNPNPSFDMPFTRLGMMATVCGNAVVSLGIARAALDEALELLPSKVPAHMQAAPAHRSSVQGDLGRAEATLSAARSYFYGSLGRAWEEAQTGPISLEARKHLQLAASHTAESGARVVDYVHRAVGGNGVLEGSHRFAQHFRDAHTITQHALCSGARFESMGQVMLGMETDWAFFHV